MTAKGHGITTARLAGGVRQGAPIDASVAGAIVAVPQEKLDAGDQVFRVATADLHDLGIEHGDLLIVEPRPRGNAATGELVLVMLGKRAFVGRWWTKRGRRALVDHALQPISEHQDLRVIGAVTVVVREGNTHSGS
jgi:SOS-response transcriptional repressor LexA